MAGQRDPQVLASLTDTQVKKSKEEIAKSLVGNWREDLLFEVKDCLSLYDFYEAKIRKCDEQLDKIFKSIPNEDVIPDLRGSRRTQRKTRRTRW